MSPTIPLRQYFCCLCRTEFWGAPFSLAFHEHVQNCMDPAIMNRILEIRREIVAAGETNAQGGPSCGVTSEEVGMLFAGGSETYGAYQLPDGSYPEHAWVVLTDGTIVDATADQFGGAPVEVIPPGDPRQARYLDRDGNE